MNMKNIIALIAILGMLSIPSLAQDRVAPPPETKPDAELTCDEADARILKYTEANKALQLQLDGLRTDITKAETDLATAVGDLKKCNDDIYAMINASEADVNAFREALGKIEGRVREMQRMNDDQLLERQDEVRSLEQQLNALRQNRIAALPEFFDKIIALAKDIKGLYREPKTKYYTVGTWSENRDCLWNIAGRNEIYGDPFQWPKIWQANTDQIKNPDIIQPGMKLLVPPAGPKTNDEMKAERQYWRKKREMMNEAGASEAGSSEAGN
jgi:hypothetical protein